MTSQMYVALYEVLTNFGIVLSFSVYIRKCCEYTKEVFMSVKERHNITMSPFAWEILSKLRAIQGKSISKIVEESLMRMLKEEGYNSTYFKIMSSVSECDDKENTEIAKALNSLKEDDLEVAEEYGLEDKTV